MDINKFFTDLEDSVGRLEEEDVGVPFGSTEYKNAKNSCKSVLEMWDQLKDWIKDGAKDGINNGKDFHVADHDLDRAIHSVENALFGIDAYLEKKKKEKDKNGRESDTSHYRVEAMREAKKTLQSQMEALDELAAERGMERPIPSNEQLAKQQQELAKGLEDATRDVRNGSSEFQDAKQEYERLNDLWEKTMGNKEEGELPTAGEIENLRANIENTRKKADDYLIKKADLNDPGPKTEKRISVMSRVKENLELQERKLADWQKKLAETEPVKSYLQLGNDTQYLSNQMEAADKGVVGGSREFKEVSSLLKQQQEKWREFDKKGRDYKLSPEELKEMVELNQKMERAVDKYMADKAGKELSPKTQKRLRTMQKVKNHCLSQQKKFEARRDEMLKEVEGISNQQMEKNNREASKDVRNANRRVYFGSREYSNAMKAYGRSQESWKEYQEREAKGEATSAQRQAQYRELTNDIKQIDKYLDKKKDKDLSKNPKTRKRVEAMEKAKRNLQTRMQKIELAEKKSRQAEREAQKKRIKERKTQLQTGVRSQERLERNMSRSALSATKQLEQLGQRKSLTAMDRRNARTAVASLVVEEKLKQPGNEALKSKLSKSGKEYAKAVKELANSKEFKKAFPDNVLTPANCRNLVNNPKVVERCAKDFDAQITQRTQTLKKNQAQRQVQRETQMQK